MWTLNFNNMTGKMVSVTADNLSNCTISGSFPITLEPGSCTARDVIATPGFEDVNLKIVLEYYTGALTVRVDFEDGVAKSEPENWQRADSEEVAPALFAVLSSADVFNIYEVYNPVPSPLPVLWSSPRNAASTELSYLEHYLPNDVFSDLPIRVYDNPCVSYNCLSWALGITESVIDPPTLLTVQAVAGILGSSARLVDNDDASANVICVGSGTTVMHFAVLRTFPTETSWSSKLGYSTGVGNDAMGMLVTHSREAFADNTGGGQSRYGTVIAAFNVEQWPTI